MTTCVLCEKKIRIGIYDKDDFISCKCKETTFHEQCALDRMKERRISRIAEKCEKCGSKAKLERVFFYHFTFARVRTIILWLLVALTIPAYVYKIVAWNFIMSTEETQDTTPFDCQYYYDLHNNFDNYLGEDRKDPAFFNFAKYKSEEHFLTSHGIYPDGGHIYMSFLMSVGLSIIYAFFYKLVFVFICREFRCCFRFIRSKSKSK